MGWFAGVRNLRGLRESRWALKLDIAGSPGFTGLTCAVAVRKGEVCWSADDPKARWPAMRRSLVKGSEPWRATNALVGGVQRLEA